MTPPPTTKPQAWLRNVFTEPLWGRSGPRTYPPAYSLYALTIGVIGLWFALQPAAARDGRTGWRASMMLRLNHRIQRSDLVAPTFVYSRDSARLREILGRYVANPVIGRGAEIRESDVRQTPLMVTDAAPVAMVPLAYPLSELLNAGSRVQLCTPGQCIAGNVIVAAVTCDEASKCTAALSLRGVDKAGFTLVRNAIKGDSLQVYYLTDRRGVP